MSSLQAWEGAGEAILAEGIVDGEAVRALLDDPHLAAVWGEIDAALDAYPLGLPVRGTYRFDLLHLIVAKGGFIPNESQATKRDRRKRLARRIRRLTLEMKQDDALADVSCLLVAELVGDAEWKSMNARLLETDDYLIACLTAPGIIEGLDALAAKLAAFEQLTVYDNTRPFEFKGTKNSTSIRQRVFARRLPSSFEELAGKPQVGAAAQTLPAVLGDKDIDQKGLLNRYRQRAK